MDIKLCLGLLYSSDIDYIEQLHVFKKIGFDAFFSDYKYGKTEQLKNAADEIGLIYQSIHAPFERMRHMWYKSDETEIAKRELKDCILSAAVHDVPIVIVHPFIGFDVNEANEFGVASFTEVVEYAKEMKINIAFENVEGEAYLEALMTAFELYENVGFCWDSGHEMCYNCNKNMLAIYGNRLIATHINDNVGVTGSVITWKDDLHLIPFDGIANWQILMDRLDKCGHKGIMTFELKMDKAIDERYGTDYTKLKFEDYVTKAYKTAVKLRDMRGL